jgi:transcriptional regulator with XRE-family HTH domain
MTVKELLIKKGIRSQSDFARKIGLSRQYAHLLWSGKRRVSVRMAERIHQKTKIPMAKLILAVPPSSHEVPHED